MFREIKQGILFTIVAMVLLGGAYHLVFWAIGHAAFADQAEGSLIRRADGTVVGSSLIAGPPPFHATASRIAQPRRGARR